MQQNLIQMPVLVTGGAGFIGSHLVELLVKKEAQVTVLDNLSTGSLDNLSHVLHKISFIKGDITDPETCFNVAKNQKIIFHLAAHVSVPGSIEQPLLCHAINVDGTINMLQASKYNRAQRFIFSSSAAIYGNREGTCSEIDIPNPESPYALSKLIGEQYCTLYTQLYKLPTIALRYFNVYGDRQTHNHPYAGVVAQFRYRMAHQLPITIFGDGNQTRDFIAVEQVIQANIAAALQPIEKLQGQSINVATGNSISLNNLINRLRIQEFPTYHAPVLFKPARQGDIKHSQADCTRFEKLMHT